MIKNVKNKKTKKFSTFMTYESLSLKDIYFFGENSNGYDKLLTFKGELAATTFFLIYIHNELKFFIFVQSLMKVK